MSEPRTVGFIGHSGSGKTTLATEVTALLTKKGRRVAAVKNAHCGFELDKPGKDTYRYKEKGAREVIVRTDDRWALMVESETKPEIDHLLTYFSQADCIIVEGFKNEGNFPKIEVRRAGVSDNFPLLFLTNADVVALATDDLTGDVAQEAQARGLTLLDINDPQAVATFIDDKDS